jgi:hypothetical protein
MNWSDPDSNPKQDMDNFLSHVRNNYIRGETMDTNQNVEEVRPLTEDEFGTKWLNLMEAEYRGSKSDWTRSQKDARNARNRRARRARRKNRSR